MTLTTISTVTSGTPSPPPAPSAPRLRLEPTGSTRTLLDGGWWPRSTDPAAELPGLILAIDKVRGPITRLILSIKGWEERPRRLSVTGRRLRVGYFTSQPSALLTALGDNGNRVDLLVVPPDTAASTAEAAMALAATASNRIHAQHLLAAAATPSARPDGGLPEQVWETEGGHFHTAGGPEVDDGTRGAPLVTVEYRH
jgi:hypothetical protein